MTIGAATYFPAGPLDIRDGTYTRLQALDLFQNVFRARTMPTKVDQLPLASVWNAGERTGPMGDANVGAPSFDHTLTLLIDIQAKAGSEADLDGEIVGFVETVRAALLTDLTWVNLFEGCERCDVRYIYPKDTEVFFAQATIEFDLMFRSTWEPVVPNDLSEIQVTASALPDAPTVLDISFQG